VDVFFADVLLPFADADNQLLKIVLEFFVCQAAVAFDSVNDFSFFPASSYCNENIFFRQILVSSVSLFYGSAFKTFDLRSTVTDKNSHIIHQQRLVINECQLRFLTWTSSWR
jgi:hypothetical protein